MTRHDRDTLASLVAHLQKRQPLERLVGKHRNTLHVLSVDTIEAFVADRSRCSRSPSRGRFLVNRTLRDLEGRLDPDRFVRVHKQAIVNLGKLLELEPIVKGGAAARLAER